jgi:hypothetical protein
MMPNDATMQDIRKEISSQTLKFVTFVTGFFVAISTGLVGATYYIAIHVK